MTKIMHGVIYGRTIELDSETGLEDGRAVEILLRTKELPGPPPGWQEDGVESAAGMMAAEWTEEDDRLLEKIHQQRRQRLIC